MGELWSRLAELGWIREHNLQVEMRWAEGRIDRLPRIMAEMVEHNVDVILTSGTPGAMAAKNATNAIPIVVASIGDPVATGLVQSLAHPGANLTGIAHGWLGGFPGKWLELLDELLPRLATLSVIFNPASPLCVRQATELEAEALNRNVTLRRIEVQTAESLKKAFEQSHRSTQAVIVLTDPLTLQYQNEITALALRHRLPSLYPNPEFVDSGGLIAYGADLTYTLKRAAEYVDKILRGAKPAEMPVEETAHIAVVINLKTAKALGITIPESILLRADEVIR
jgi:putative ABC transport system substrate-binding protein